MQATIGSTLLTKLKPRINPYDVRDNRLIGFIVRVNISGKMIYMCEYARGKRITIGKVGILTVSQARDRAKEILADYVKGIDPRLAKQREKLFTLELFLNNEYSQWAIANRKDGKGTLKRININFVKDFGHKKLSELTIWDLEKWKSQKLSKGIKASTVNRDIVALKAALSKAVEWKLIEVNPLLGLKPSKVDSIAMLRYLSRNEECQLRDAIDKREEVLKAKRASGNTWRRERGYKELPNLHDKKFADHVKPMILLSLNTGLRRGELFNLSWDAVNLTISNLTVKADTSKSGRCRHIPLNNEALSILIAWREQQTNTSGFVFPSKDERRFGNVKRAWISLLKIAKINNFRWHDMRHHFASRLVMSGVDLNTVRELLGHSDIKMTLRYAHLAPEHKAEAVSRLCY